MGRTLKSWWNGPWRMPGGHRIHIHYIPYCFLCKFLTLWHVSQNSFFFRVIDKDWGCRRLMHNLTLNILFRSLELACPWLYSRRSQASKGNAWCVLRCLARNSVRVIGLKWLQVSVKIIPAPAPGHALVTREPQKSIISLYAEEMPVADFFMRELQPDSRLSFQDICFISIP